MSYETNLPELFPLAGQPGIPATDHREAIIAEVRSGLRNERVRLKEASENNDYADLGGDHYVPRREAETEFDYASRVKRVTGLVHQCLGRLCSHTYNPGPTRTVDGGGAAEEWLQAAYESNHIDCVMNEAERLSTLNDVAAIQVSVPADPADRERKPVDLQIWGSEEFAVFLDPNDQRKPLAVCVLDKVDEQTRFRLWFADEVRTFVTAKAGDVDGRRTEGGTIAYDAETEPNPYGCLPFAFVHYKAPVRHFWTRSPGSFLRESEASLNAQVSELAECIGKYSKPIGCFRNVGPEFNPEVGPGRFLRLMRSGSTYSGDGFETAGEPDAFYLQAQLAIEQCWGDIEKMMGQVAEAVDLPPSALRLDYTDAPSGLSIVVRAFPLLARARQRRPIYQRAEYHLACVILKVCGGFYGKPELTAAAADLKLALSWPEPRIPIPGPERDEADAWEIRAGIKSRLMVLMERYGLSRDQAIAHLQQVAEDENQTRAILPEPENAPEAGDRGGKPGNDDEGDYEADEE